MKVIVGLRDFSMVDTKYSHETLRAIDGDPLSGTKYAINNPHVQEGWSSPESNESSFNHGTEYKNKSYYKQVYEGMQILKCPHIGNLKLSAAHCGDPKKLENLMKGVKGKH